MPALSGPGSLLRLAGFAITGVGTTGRIPLREHDTPSDDGAGISCVEADTRMVAPSPRPCRLCGAPRGPSVCQRTAEPVRLRRLSSDYREQLHPESARSPRHRLPGHDAAAGEPFLCAGYGGLGTASGWLSPHQRSAAHAQRRAGAVHRMAAGRGQASAAEPADSGGGFFEGHRLGHSRALRQPSSDDTGCRLYQRPIGGALRSVLPARVSLREALDATWRETMVAGRDGLVGSLAPG